MNKPRNVGELDRVRLSENFFMRGMNRGIIP